tara:strand:+ start:18554 stop:18916 length:363 start_codon:yes stop_codon:yes gene_type:complete
LSELAQYALLFGLTIGTLGFVLTLYSLARVFGRTRAEPGKDVPASAGELSREPVWVRYHAKYYGYALLFLAFDMEMAFMYPWSVVYREEGLVALLDMGVFLAILFLGLLYGWSQGALRRQ